MKPDTLETLLLDHALGELSPEAGELLEAWCREHPPATASGAAIAATLGLARQASADTAPVARHPLPPARWKNGVARPRLPEWFRLAACLALGAGLGWALRPTSIAHPSPRALPVAQGAAVEAPPASSHFWSVSARVAAARHARPEVERPRNALLHRRSSFLQPSLSESNP